MAERLFVYGTLHPNHAPSEVADLVRRFKRIAKGTVHGHLYDLGDFPAMILDPEAGLVKGIVFELPHDPDAFSRLDAYEEYSPEDPGESLFLRQRTNVTLSDGAQLECWVYVYNRPLPNESRLSPLASVA